jgi:hypothetical protein
MAALYDGDRDFHVCTISLVSTCVVSSCRSMFCGLHELYAGICRQLKSAYECKRTWLPGSTKVTLPPRNSLCPTHALLGVAWATVPRCRAESATKRCLSCSGACWMKMRPFSRTCFTTPTCWRWCTRCSTSCTWLARSHKHKTCAGGATHCLVTVWLCLCGLLCVCVCALYGSYIPPCRISRRWA